MSAHFARLEEQYRKALLEDVIPFWERNSIDREYGGYFSCLDREGNVYDTDKFIWLQARQVWTFSMLYNRVEKRQEWIDIARHGAEFLMSHGRDDGGDWYFALDREGRALVQPYNIFSDCFAAMGLSQYALASGNAQARQVAEDTYYNIIARKENPKGKYDKHFPGTRQLKSFALPMILANLVQEMDWILGQHRVRQDTETAVREVMTRFLDEESGLIYENVALYGSHPDTFDGRVIIPGHGIEAMWFIMDIANRRGDKELINKCVDTMMRILSFGWDREHQGIYYYLDARGKPPLQLEWDRKLWWVHLEALVALSMGYLLTGRSECIQWYQRVHEYSWSRYSDPQFGEWYGYLDREGRVFIPLKGGKWKGCFHVPRAFHRCWTTFRELAKK